MITVQNIKGDNSREIIQGR